MRICIVGSGIAGLTAAHHLSKESNATVSIIEASDHFGGRANVTEGGEHCPRFFLDDYRELFRILHDIPFGQGSVFDLLQPVRRFASNAAGSWVEISTVYPIFAPELSLHDRWVVAQNNRRSFLVARRASSSGNAFGAAANFSPRGFVTALYRSARPDSSAYALPGDTNEHLIAPWIRHLRAHGVTFRSGARADRITPDDSGVTVTVAGAPERYDLVILALFAPDAYELVDRSGRSRQLDWRTHTHCRCFTIDLDPREPLLQDPSPRAYSRHGIMTLVQPAAQRCISVPILAHSTSPSVVVAQLAEDLGLTYPPLSVRYRDNAQPSEAVFVGDHVQPSILRRSFSDYPTRVYAAGSYLLNDYAVDSAEGACLSALDALDAIADDHPVLQASWRRTPPPSTRHACDPGVYEPHANICASRSSSVLWLLARTLSALAVVSVSRLSIVDPLRTHTAPARQPAVYVANHRSIFDVCAGLRTFNHLGVHPHLVVAHRYFRGLAGRILAAVGAFPALRGSDATILAAIDAINAGNSVAFMVEGRITDSTHAATAPYGRGAFEVAAATGAPIVPIGSSGTDAVWPQPRPWPLLRLRRPRVVVMIGNPIPADIDPPSLTKRIRVALCGLETDAARRLAAMRRGEKVTTSARSDVALEGRPDRLSGLPS